ncbi:MAG: hypothetical protein U9N59_14860 [Campylobacterota bacterium]|nr:hypothetical protein [Campylobacterota bacterium]
MSNDSEVIHQAFRILNSLEEKYDWNKMIKETASIMNINVEILEKALVDSKLYKWDKNTKSYILI